MTVEAAATPLSTRQRIRSVVSVLMILHAVIHLMAPADLWGWIAFEERISPTIAVPEASLDLLAVLWIGAAALLLVAAWLIRRRSPAWRPVALAGVVVSQMLTVIWWAAAGFATVANALILTAVLTDRRFGLSAPDPVDLPPCCRS